MALPLNKWIEVTRNVHLTVADVVQLPNGAPLYCLCLCRNIIDFTDGLDPGRPAEFFKKAYRLKVWKADDGVKVRGTVLCDDENENEVDPDEKMHFDIEYQDDCWYPLEANDGTALPVRSIDPGHVRLHERDMPKPATAYPPWTRLGWRGPVIPMNRLHELPDVGPWEWDED